MTEPILDVPPKKLRSAFMYARGFVLVLVLLASTAALWAPPAVGAPGETRVGANFSFHEGPYDEVRGLRVEIWRDGVKVVNRPATIPCEGCEPQPMPGGYSTKPVRVVQLDSTPEPEVVFTILSAGAHCCAFAKIFRWDGGLERYLDSTHNFYDGIYLLQDLRHNGIPLFVDTDTLLAYRFSCYACAIYPPQISEYRTGRIVDVTPRFPREIKENLTKARRSYRRIRPHDSRGMLATVAADYCLLGRCGAGFAFVRRAISRGRASGNEPHFEGSRGRKFIPALRRFLHAHGYL